MKVLLLTLIMVSGIFSLTHAQDELDDLLSDLKPHSKEYTTATFKTTRIINAHSIETMYARSLDIRISHRFGDLAGSNGFHTLFGFDQAADIFIGAEYGITDNLTVGYGRMKGAGPLRELYNANIKYRALRQTTDNKMPLSLTIQGNATISAMRRSEDKTSVTNMPKFAHRMSYFVQAIAARKFGERVSLAVIPGFLHRNFVPYGDENSTFVIGGGGRIMFTKRMGIVFDAFYPVSAFRSGNKGPVPYYFPLGIGFEFETGGHIFHINFTNSEGILENDFIPYTSKNWLNGEFRLGFTISRVFSF